MTGVVAAAMAATPLEWFEREVRPVYDAYGPFDASSARWVTMTELLGDGPNGLVALHQRMCRRDGTPPATAATYLAGWFAGFAAEIVGLGLATAGAGLLVDPTTLRWHLHADDWPERIELGDAPVVVTPDHPWADTTDARIVPDLDAVVAVTVRHLVHELTPIVTACHGLAKVGSAGLWNEVGDGLVMVLRHHDHLEVDGSMIDIVTRAAHVSGVPWRSHARLWFAPGSAGPVCVGQKGGCCLAYKRPRDEAVASETDTPDLTAFRERFPDDPDVPRYCGTCSQRDPADCEARQLFWIERRRT